MQLPERKKTVGKLEKQSLAAAGNVMCPLQDLATQKCALDPDRVGSEGKEKKKKIVIPREGVERHEFIRRAKPAVGSSEGEEKDSESNGGLPEK